MSEKEGKECTLHEFIDCVNVNCDCRMRYDPDDREYSCGSCNTTLSKVITPNELEFDMSQPEQE